MELPPGRPQQCGCSGGGWGAGWLPARDLCQEFPSPGSLLRRRKKLFTRDTARNCRAKLTSCLGEKQAPARGPGTRNPGVARRAAEGEGTAPAPSRGTSRGPRGARTRSSAGLGRTRPPPPGPIEFLCTTVIGAKRLFECSPDFQAAGISFSCSTPTPLMARSGCRKPPPLLRAASSHAGPASELAASGDAAGGPSEETKLVLGGGERGPRNCLKTVPLLEETLDALRAPRSLPAPTLSGVQSFSQSRWPW